MAGAVADSERQRLHLRIFEPARRDLQGGDRGDRGGPAGQTANSNPTPQINMSAWARLHERHDLAWSPG